MMSSILTNIFAKSSPAPRSVNGDKESRGTKRKAKSDPYDEIDDGKKIIRGQRYSNRLCRGFTLCLS